MEKFKIECEYLTGPVTALHIINDKYILAGFGSYLCVFHISERTCIGRASILSCCCIHGIRQSHFKDLTTIGVFGEKCVCVVNLNIEENRSINSNNGDGSPIVSLVLRSKVREMEDWIWDAMFLSKEEGEDLVTALGHNTVIRWNWRTDAIIQKVQCVENCILYCAKFINSNWVNLLLAAGTVFNEILLWQPGGQRSELDQVTVMRSLEGHKGVIFSIHFSEQKRIMCSASDDRSIRMWKFDFADDTDHGIPIASWELCDISCIHVLYGHSARVWDVRLLTNIVVSVGEDSTCCVWNYDGNILQKFKGHKGKSIWSLATDREEEFVVTGGGDSSIRLWKLNLTSEKAEQTSFTIQLPSTGNGKEEDYPRSVVLMGHNDLVIVTNEGYIYLYQIDKAHWITVQSDPQFRSYTVVATSPGTPIFLALGNIQGKLKILWTRQKDNKTNLKEWRSRNWDIYKGKIMSVHWLSDTELLTTGPNGIIKIWKLETVNGEVELRNLCQYFLPCCKQRWVSAAGVCSTSLICGDRGGTVHVYRYVPIMEESDEAMIMPVQSFVKIHGKTGVTGICCHGNTVYTTGRDGQYRIFSHEDGKLIFLNSHRVYKGFEWIDKIVLTDESTDCLIYGFQSSDFVIWSVNCNQKLVQIPCGGGHRSWDCSFKADTFRFVYQKAREVVVCETKLLENQLKVKDALHGREITCAKFLLTGKEKLLIVTGSEDTSVQISSLSYNRWHVMEMCNIQQLHGHISSVRTLSLSTSCLQKEANTCKLLFSAGGRAQLIIWRITLGVKSNSSGTMEDSSGGREDLVTENLHSYMIGQSNRKGRTRMWKLQQIKLNPETRFMDLCSICVSEIWTDLPNDIHIVAAACSDAFVRFYLFDETKNEFSLLMDSQFHQHCVLKITYFIHLDSKNSNTLMILSAATDGCIAFWNMSKHLFDFVKNKFHNNQIKNEPSCTESYKGSTESYKEHDSSFTFNKTGSDEEDESCDMLNCDVLGTKKKYTSDKLCFSNHHKLSTADKEEDTVPLYTLNHHQSGVNGLDAFHIPGHGYLIASGGDDNAIKISLIDMENGIIRVKATGGKVDAHATEITGVKILSKSCLLSVSIDQRLIVWDVKITESTIQIAQQYCKFVSVPDISNLDTVVDLSGNVHILLPGEGLAHLTVRSDETAVP